ncbi:FUSC family protein [uncultured Algibacter sp.]|uniref:FUSC family protein n=1 Tax=uncultured Algibacter sp. TaxID=298659 RepID=UPI00262BA3A7|nr:FUSC family protein [uncultured Algibacter sp.]
MQKLFTILALIASILAIILSVLPVSNLAIFPAIFALLSGIAAFYFSKKSGQIKKIIQFTFLLTAVALSITIYKAIFNTTEVADTQELIEKEKEAKEEAIEELEDLDLEELELDDINLE